VALWAGLVFYASSRSDVGPAGALPDWATHGAAYFLGGALLARALAGGLFRTLPPRHALASVLLITLYGCSDELHQSYTPGRDPSLGDVAKDAAGAALGAFAVGRLGQRRRIAPA
jgi:VanZ family protein